MEYACNPGTLYTQHEFATEEVVCTLSGNKCYVNILLLIVLFSLVLHMKNDRVHDIEIFLRISFKAM